MPRRLILVSLVMCESRVVTCGLIALLDSFIISEFVL